MATTSGVMLGGLDDSEDERTERTLSRGPRKRALTLTRRPLESIGNSPNVEDRKAPETPAATRAALEAVMEAVGDVLLMEAQVSYEDETPPRPKRAEAPRPWVETLLALEDEEPLTPGLIFCTGGCWGPTLNDAYVPEEPHGHTITFDLDAEE